LSGVWQLLREWPPGYGGVERVAHELASVWQLQGSVATVFSLVAQPRELNEPDPLPVVYQRVPLPSLPLGRLVLPLPSRALLRLLTASEPLHAHLPCPAVLALALIARLLRPRRAISLHWHSFLEPAPTPAGRLFGLYQRLAERLLPCFTRIITTSPVLRAELIAAGAAPAVVRVLPCSLPEPLEQQAAQIAIAHLAATHLDAAHLAAAPPAGLRLISIGRLDSYKRIDWLIEALAAAQQRLPQPAPCLHLDVVGDGPDRLALEHQATAQAPGQVQFHGRVDEATKLALLARADLLVLAANRCNEAFGIVQLEAMACAVPAVALEHPRSGMAWVSGNLALPWDGRRRALPGLMARLASDPTLLARARRAAHQRYQEQFARAVWLQRLQEAFAP
jgi:glycosyltransferase involved in cell wall biosynthesis